jgi:hypothetical protein
MADVTLVADLLIALIEGIKSKKQIKSYYDQYERNFEGDVEQLAVRFDHTMAVINALFGDSLKVSAFRRIHLFYSLFTAVAHLLYALPALEAERRVLAEAEYPRVRSRLETIDAIFQADDPADLTQEDRRFLEDSRRATTDAAVRVRRTQFILRRALNG